MSQTRLSREQLEEIRPRIPQVYDIFGVVKVYQAHNGTWSSTGTCGLLLVSGSGIAVLGFPSYDLVLVQPFYSGFLANDLSPSFLAFEGDSCVFGLSFTSETEMGRAFDRITEVNVPTSPSKSPSSDGKSGFLSSFKSLFKNKEEAPPLAVSKPSGFKRTHHIGLDSSGQFKVENLPREWLTVLSRQYGIEIQNEEEERIAKRVIKKHFKKQNKTEPQPRAKPLAPVRRPLSSTSSSTDSTAPKQPPPVPTTPFPPSNVPSNIPPPPPVPNAPPPPPLPSTPSAGNPAPSSAPPPPPPTSWWSNLSS
ncbi:hypothetical protein GEMRC1_008091 [Eukaryota sp. GEM-RC1]